mmetsp:Transcript_18686/g.26168  ORF Transcript_18686/g.26168 Transcript_18686/m.26168 type:complete len:342 (-) Transcript_18686:902-1927(-)
MNIFNLISGLLGQDFSETSEEFKLVTERWVISSLYQEPFAYISGITSDNMGNLYFAMESQIVQIQESGHAQVFFDGDQDTDHFFISHLVCDGNNTLYFIESMHELVYIFSIDTMTASVLAGTTPPLVHDGINEKLFCPSKLFLDKENSLLYVGEQSSIRRINLHTKKFDTIAGSRKLKTKHARNGPLDQATFGQITGIFMGNNDTLYVTDVKGGIRQIKDGFISSVCPHMHQPRCILADSTDCLFVVSNAQSGTSEESIVHKIDLRQKFYVVLVRGYFIDSLAFDKDGHLLVGTRSELLRLQMPWKWKRLLWIGHLKEDRNYCPLAGIPTDLLRIISLYLE